MAISKGSLLGTRRMLAPKDLSSLAISSVTVKAMLRNADTRVEAVATERTTRAVLAFPRHNDFASKRPSIPLTFGGRSAISLQPTLGLKRLPRPSKQPLSGESGYIRRGLDRKSTRLNSS